MNLLTVTIIFMSIQIFLTIFKIVAETLWINNENSATLEWIFNTIILISYYFVILKYALPGWCFLASIGMAVFCFLSSWLIPRLTELFFFVGEYTECLTPIFIVIQSFLLFFIFLPKAFPNIFKNKIPIFIGILIVEFFIIGLYNLILIYFDDRKVNIIIDYLLHLLFSFSIIIITRETSQKILYAWEFSSILIVVSNIEAIGLFFISARLFQIIEFSKEFWIRRLIIFSGQALIVIFIFLLPVVSSIAKYLGKFLGY